MRDEDSASDNDNLMPNPESLLPFPLVVEQPFLPPEAAAVAAERAVGADDAVAGNDNGKHVRAVRSADGASGIGYPEALCHP